jgi:hypothetical protein
MSRNGLPINGRLSLIRNEANVIMDPEKLLPGTSFVDNILGPECAEDTVLYFTFPDDYDDEEIGWP